MVVGATLVALGTSSPELATALTSRASGFSEIGVGTALGSNVFNRKTWSYDASPSTTA